MSSLPSLSCKKWDQQSRIQKSSLESYRNSFWKKSTNLMHGGMTARPIPIIPIGSITGVVQKIMYLGVVPASIWLYIEETVMRLFSFSFGTIWTDRQQDNEQASQPTSAAPLSYLEASNQLRSVYGTSKHLKIGWQWVQCGEWRLFISASFDFSIDICHFIYHSPSMNSLDVLMKLDDRFR